jgi:hypothetical protein
VDVGCGKGGFLKTLCGLYPDVRGLGVDPSYVDIGEDRPSNVRFVNAYFSAQHIQEQPALVTCRHVLEHIPNPVAFMREIRTGLAAFAETPLFLEVPDLEWILSNSAFWDFCYEHCNYFTQQSMAALLKHSGFLPAESMQNAFGGQYLWVETQGTSEAEAQQTCAPPTLEDTNLAERARQYSREEEAYIQQTRALLLSRKQRSQSIVLWGMATKGIMYAQLIDKEGTLVDHHVDINEDRHFVYTPLTGKQIKPPESLPLSTALTIVVMNPNYLQEIAAQCGALGLSASFLSADSSQNQEADEERLA